MTYNEFIQNIINTRGQWSIPDGEYFEKHHIIPRCIGGDDTKENIIYLYANEHYIAHELLAIENQDNYKLVYAWNMLSNFNSEGVKLDEENYEILRKLHSDYMKINNPNIINSPWNKGLTKETNESVKRTAEKLKGHHRGKGVPKSKLHRQHLSESKKGKQSGVNNPFYGKHHTDDTKKKIGMKNSGKSHNVSDETRCKMSAALRNSDKAKEFHERLKKKVICVETGVIYDSISNAKLITGINGISSCAAGKRKTAGGYTWKYYER